MSKDEKKPAGRTYSGLSQEQRKSMRRQQFLDAGLEVFGTVGFRAATVRRLCREAKLTDRYFYEAFGSLEKLLIAVYEYHMGKLRQRIVQAVSDTKPGTDMLTITHTALNCYFAELEDPRVARVCMVELEGISPEVDILYNGYITGFAELILWFVQRVHPNWELSEAEFQVLGISLVGAMRQAATNWLLSDYHIDRKTMVEVTSKIFIGLMNLIETEQS